MFHYATLHRWSSLGRFKIKTDTAWSRHKHWTLRYFNIGVLDYVMASICSHIKMPFQHCGYAGNNLFPACHNWLDNLQFQKAVYRSPNDREQTAIKIIVRVVLFTYLSTSLHLVGTAWSLLSSTITCIFVKLSTAISVCINVHVGLIASGTCEESPWTAFELHTKMHFIAFYLCPHCVHNSFLWIAYCPSDIMHNAFVLNSCLNIGIVLISSAFTI